MLTPHELRKGNLLLVNNDGDWSVEVIDYIAKDREGFTGWFIKFESGSIYKFIDEPEYILFKPIPLENKIFRRLGFVAKPMYSWKGNGADYQPETSRTENYDFVLNDNENDEHFFARYSKWYWRKSEEDAWNIDETYFSFYASEWYEKQEEYFINSNNIEYVHQLQNLYQSVKHKELQYKRYSRY